MNTFLYFFKSYWVLLLGSAAGLSLSVAALFSFWRAGSLLMSKKSSAPSESYAKTWQRLRPFFGQNKFQVLTVRKAGKASIYVAVFVAGMIAGLMMRDEMLRHATKDLSGLKIIEHRGEGRYLVVRSDGVSYEDEFCAPAPEFPAGATFKKLRVEDMGHCKRLVGGYGLGWQLNRNEREHIELAKGD